MYVITKQSREQQRYFNQKSKRWYLDKSKATEFGKNTEAQKVAGILKVACFVINSKTEKKTRVQFSRKGKEPNAKKVQILVNLKRVEVEALGGVEKVKELFYAAVKKS